MALETIEDVKEVDRFNLDQFYSGELFNNDCYILVAPKDNEITFKIQDGPIKQVGVNGLQVTTIIETAKLTIEGFNKKFPCSENACAIAKLDEALMWLEKRRKDREKRGVEGLDRA